VAGITPPEDTSAILSLKTSLPWPRKGILRSPREHFPEDPNPVIECVAVLHAKGRNLPEEATWTEVSRRVVSPEALAFGNVRYGLSDDYVVVYQALSARSIKAYATLTKHIRSK
jgi:hypothetical protein